MLKESLQDRFLDCRAVLLPLCKRVALVWLFLITNGVYGDEQEPKEPVEFQLDSARVFVRSLLTQEDPQCITPNEFRSADPAWSPDGTQLVVESDRDGNWEIHLITLGTGIWRNLSQAPDSMDRAPHWCPENNRIAFVSNRTGDLRVYSMNPDGGDVVCHTCETGPPGYHDTPQYSPDGTKILFAAYEIEFEGSRIYSLDVEANSLTCWEALGNDCFEPVWAATGIIACSRPNTDGYYRLLQASSPQEKAEEVGLHERSYLGDYRSPAWSSQNEQLYYSFPSMHTWPDWRMHIYRDAVGDDPVCLTLSLQLPSDCYGFNQAAVSPKGDRIAFTGNASGERSAAYFAWRDAVIAHEMTLRRRSGWFILGAQGEIITLRYNLPPLLGTVVIIEHDDHSLELRYAGIVDRGLFGKVTTKGIVEIEDATLPEKVVHGFPKIWPIIDPSGRPSLPIQHRVYSTSTSPEQMHESITGRAEGCVVVTIDGTLLPVSPATTAASALWFVRKETSLDIVSVAQGEQIVARIDANLELRILTVWNGCPMAVDEKCPWPYSNEAGQPMPIPEGHELTLPCTGRSLRVIRDDGLIIIYENHTRLGH
jgi:hypothetical protein